VEQALTRIDGLVASQAVGSEPDGAPS